MLRLSETGARLHFFIEVAGEDCGRIVGSFVHYSFPFTYWPLYEVSSLFVERLMDNVDFLEFNTPVRYERRLVVFLMCWGGNLKSIKREAIPSDSPGWHFCLGF